MTPGHDVIMYAADRVVVVGGTFSPIHNGHRALLQKAFQTANHDGDGQGHVVIALTIDELARGSRTRASGVDRIPSFTVRRESLEEELDRMSRAYTVGYEIIPLEDVFGPAVSETGIDALVVSPEAAAQRRAYEVNDRRLADGHRPLEIHTPPFIVAEDGERISATRIRRGEIDEHGRLLD